MKVCVLQPDYSTTDVDYKNYDPPRNLAKLLPGDEVHNIFLNKLTTYKQLKASKKENFDIYVNLCEGYLEWSVPSIDVIHALDLLNLPYTGPNDVLYDPPKPLMKYVAYSSTVATPNFIEVGDIEDIESKIKRLSFPLFAKPANAGDSLGIDKNSLINNLAELKSKINYLLQQEYDDILIEEYIAGREFTVLVAANPKPAPGCVTFKPVEYQFSAGNEFKTYAIKTSELHTDENKPCDDEGLEKELRSAAEKIFNTFSGVGYARLDFRVDQNNKVYFLEINFTCSVFYEVGLEGSADYILRFDPIGKAGFLKHIVAEGIARHTAKQKKYTLKGNSISGYGIVANRFIKKGEVIFELEASALRIVTRRYVEEHWNTDQLTDFKHYAYPISDEVYILWDKNPQNWAPQNHSCDANTVYDGLNLVAVHNLNPGEELTLDYADLLDDNIQPFKCSCGSVNCREIITGTKGNSITSREKQQ